MAAAVLAAAMPAAAQPRYQKYSQKLAPYVPSPHTVVQRMLELAGTHAGDTVYDLGCGDGRVLIAAAQKFQAKGVGIEVDEKLVKQTTERITQMNLQDQVRVVQGDILNADLSGADVVVMYLLTGSNELLRPRLEKMLKPGTRVVSYSYKIPGWVPKKVDKTDQLREIYLYEMPPTKQ